MKTILSRSLVVVLVASTVLGSAHAVMGPQRAAKCIFQPDKWKCSDADKKEAKKWLIGGSIAAITLAAATIGIGSGFALAAKKKAEKESGSSATSSEVMTYEDLQIVSSLLLEFKSLQDEIMKLTNNNFEEFDLNRLNSNDEIKNQLQALAEEYQKADNAFKKEPNNGGLKKFLISQGISEKLINFVKDR